MNVWTQNIQKGRGVNFDLLWESIHFNTNPNYLLCTKPVWTTLIGESQNRCLWKSVVFLFCFFCFFIVDCRHSRAGDFSTWRLAPLTTHLRNIYIVMSRNNLHCRICIHQWAVSASVWSHPAREHRLLSCGVRCSLILHLLVITHSKIKCCYFLV